MITISVEACGGNSRRLLSLGGTHGLVLVRARMDRERSIILQSRFRKIEQGMTKTRKRSFVCSFE